MRGAKAACVKIKYLGVDQQKIKIRQSALGLMQDKGNHWTPFLRAEEPSLTEIEWKQMRPPWHRGQPPPALSPRRLNTREISAARQIDNPRE